MCCWSTTFSSSSGKEGTQNEFFHTFNALHDAQKQIVISSDRPPHEIPALEERLRSRFEWGLIADIQVARSSKRRRRFSSARPRKKACRCPNDVAMFMASRIKSNVRELEGSLIRLIAYSSLTTKPLTIELAQEVLRNVIDHDEKAVTIEQIQKYVADYYHLKLARVEVPQQLQVGRDAAPGRDVSLQVADARVAARNRPQLRRQASLDGDSLDQEGRRDAQEERRFRQAGRQPARIVQVTLPVPGQRLARSFSTARLCMHLRGLLMGRKTPF